MKELIKRIMKFVAYTAAAVVILLAVGVGLFRLFLPRLPEYQDEIKLWASNAIGMQVEFSGMDARWGLSGPELEFFDAELLTADTRARIVAASEVSIGVALFRLLSDRTLVVDRVGIRDSRVEIRHYDDGTIAIQGNPLDQLLAAGPAGGAEVGDIEIVGEDLKLLYLRPGDQRPTVFDVPRITASSNRQRIAVDGLVRLPEALGRQVVVTATRLKSGPATGREWLLTLRGIGLDLAGASAFARTQSPGFDAGGGEVELSLAFSGDGVRSAAAVVDLEDVVIGEAAFEAIAGRVDYRVNTDGWLVAGDDIRITSGAGSWPESSYRLKMAYDAQDRVTTVDAQADYMDLGELVPLSPFLPDAIGAMLSQYAPDGIVRDLTATVSELHTDTPQFSVSAAMERAGIAPVGAFPGVRGFTGRLRADRNGGRLEIQSTDLVVDLPDYLSSPIPVAAAFGTIIWRQGLDRLTILSDNIALSNSDFESRSNVQVTIDGTGAPVIDLASDWQVMDIAGMKRFIPASVMHPQLYDWFQMALVSGQVRNGSTRLYGPLDKFPFDEGEGRFLLEGQVRESTFRFLRRWPAVEIDVLEVVLDNTRLYTGRNRSRSQGLDVVDAEVEIADLRRAVLEIKSSSSGKLATIQDYAKNSPINDIFGGQIDRLKLDGDADFSLDLNVPLLSWRDFTFTTRITTDNGVLTVQGFEPAISELSGTVTIEKDLVGSESLTGTFLGEPVELELLNAPADSPFQVVARATGVATGRGLVEDLGAPLAGLVDGQARYRADVLFPRANDDAPTPLTVRVESDLAGLGLALPAPLTKSEQDAAALEAEIRFADGGDRIESSGRSDIADIAWELRFEPGENGHLFERGMLALRQEPVLPETRGLYIAGALDSFRLGDWLALRDEGRGGPDFVDWIRAAEVVAGEFELLGQRLVDHRIVLDRSARDWLLQIDGADVAGSVFVPYEFTADRPIVLDMERLVLPGGDDGSARSGVDREDLDPATLPPVSVETAEFALGNRSFGALQAEFQQTGQGLVAERIVATADSFDIVANGGWTIDAEDPMGSRTRLVATLTSSNVEKTMQRLGYQPGIVGEDMTLLLDLGWSGGPRSDFVDTLDGEVQVRFGPGNLDEIEPGAGRVFGLMSVVALPRRLSLDFSDVFGKGFGFDRIVGDFRIVDGDTYTCNLSLEGPAADIGIIGRASLVERDYEQTAIVSANFGNTLPVVGAVVAGPQVAAALLIFSQIFKKPLKEMGQVYYSIDGSWDAPEIDGTDAADFAESGRRAGCISDNG